MDKYLILEIMSACLLLALYTVEGESSCLNEAVECGGHGVCRSDGRCACESYYAGSHCQECMLCGGEFKDVWSCVECTYNRHARDHRFCKQLMASDRCDNIRYMIYPQRVSQEVSRKLEQYNLVHSIRDQHGQCVMKYGVDIPEGARLADVYAKVCRSPHCQC